MGKSGERQIPVQIRLHVGHARLRECGFGAQNFKDARQAIFVACADRVGGALCGFELFAAGLRSEAHTSELQSLMRSSYVVFCLNNKMQYVDLCVEGTERLVVSPLG